MDRLSKLLAVALLVGAFVSVPSAALAADNCSTQELQTGTCTTATVDPDRVTLGAEITTPPDAPDAPDGRRVDSGSGEPEPDVCELAFWDANRCTSGIRDSRGRDLDEDPITLSDIAAFRPDPGVDHMQPNGWMIVGLDTNFYAQVAQQVHNGTLLGLPASVRFTPVEYHWQYGDGSSASRTTKGSTWASLGIAEFDRTPTSHVYDAPGTYLIDLSIEFAAEYRIGNMPWTPIAGTLTVPANQLEATAGDAKTVLVEQECTRNPSGPGC